MAPAINDIARDIGFELSVASQVNDADGTETESARGAFHSSAIGVSTLRASSAPK